MHIPATPNLLECSKPEVSEIQAVSSSILRREILLLRGTWLASNDEATLACGDVPARPSLYATKSGAKRVFSGADVIIPVGAHDIYDRDELLSALVKLIATNLDVARWITRIDDDHDCANVAYLDVKALRQGLLPAAAAAGRCGGAGRALQVRGA